MTDLASRVERELIRAALFGTGEAPRIGRFVVERLLGAGASAVVFAARDAALERRVAVKVLERRDAVVEREARALARLRHGNVVTVYDVGEWDGHPFIAMELVDGETLETWQAGRGTRELVAVYLEAGRGLEAAHRVGLVHRDFKPANVLVTADRRAVIGDFGLVGDARDARSMPAGTPAYLAPEQALGAAPDPRADVYSFCVALREALRGHRVPVRVRTALDRGLAIDPSDRWPAMAPLLEVLEHAGRRRWTIALAATGIAGATAAGLWLAAHAHTADAGAELAGAPSSATEQLDQDPVAALDALQAVPVARRGEPWAVAARSALVKASSELIACQLPGPITEAIFDGERAIGLAEDGRVAVCELERASTTVVGSARCIRAIDRDAFAAQALTGAMERYERAGGAWHRRAAPEEGPCATRPGATHGARSVTVTAARAIEVTERGATRTIATAADLVRIDPEGRRALVVSSGRAAVIELDREAELAAVAITGRVQAAQLARDRAFVVTRDGVLGIWAADDGWRSSRALHPYVVAAVSSPSGDRVALLSFAGAIEVHDRATGAIDELASAGNFERLGFTSEDTVVALHRDGRALRWRLGAQRATVVGDHAGGVWVVAASGRAVAAGGKDGVIRIAGETGAITTLAVGAPVYALRFDGDRLLAGAGDGTVQVWSWRTGHRLAALPGDGTWAYDVELAGGAIVVGTKAGAVRVDGTELVPAAGVRINDVAVSADGRRAAAVTAAGRLYLIDVAQHRVIGSFEAHRGWARRAGFTAGGAEVITAGDDGWLRRWSSADGRLLWATRAHVGPIFDLDVQGDLVASAGADGAAALWRVSTGARLRNFRDHRAAINVVRLRGDGRWLVTGDVKGRIGLWSADREACHAWLLGHRGEIRSLAFTGDHRIASGSDDGTARVWRPIYDAGVPALPAPR